MDIGSRIRAARKARGQSQEALARRAGVSLNVIGRIENGVITDPHYSTLVGIARALDIPIAELLEEEPVVSGKAEAPRDSGPSSVEVDEAIEKLGRLEDAVVAKRTEIESRLERLRRGPFVDLERLSFDAGAHHFFYEKTLKDEFRDVRDEPSVRDAFNRVRAALEFGFAPVVDDVLDAYRAMPEGGQIDYLDDYRKRKTA